jgi:hypothetical protein
VACELGRSAKTSVKTLALNLDGGSERKHASTSHDKGITCADWHH